MKKSIINWSEVSRLLTNKRSAIRGDYSRKKYDRIVKRIKRVEKALLYFISKNK